MGKMKLEKRLEKRGNVATVEDEKSRAFDIAFAEERAYLIKLIGNIESISISQAESLKQSAAVVGAEAVIVSKRGKDELKPGVAYFRHDVPVMRDDTLMDYLNGEKLAVADRGGIKCPTQNIRELRLEKGLSRSALGKMLGVSKEMIKKYEIGSSPGKVIAEKIKKVLGDSALSKLKFDRQRIDRAFIGRAPFELAFRQKKELFLVSFKENSQRLKNLNRVADVLGAEPVLARERGFDELI
ncbi:MAG: helix-turn-helix domain-containing protein [Candidatus Altiarchaeota archaeon]|nr:helix-turn-helix domain-containing protein [Candidatus Altiarchaeota archaeon]